MVGVWGGLELPCASTAGGARDSRVVWIWLKHPPVKPQRIDQGSNGKEKHTVQGSRVAHRPKTRQKPPWGMASWQLPAPRTSGARPGTSCKPLQGRSVPSCTHKQKRTKSKARAAKTHGHARKSTLAPKTPHESRPPHLWRQAGHQLQPPQQGLRGLWLVGQQALAEAQHAGGRGRDGGGVDAWRGRGRFGRLRLVGGWGGGG